ncbi:hypothetical protein PHYBLDRAFT_140507 [Phycomyces blakesleeanus NRRL 1555(-)]|uniref:Uncharacterized protein n=1 Tax=Phycomyces blakesleeanus (strain ATCC 8743b / DSM 1359 / FGSC 10004 / NBRC 33097 / NRRL 1555) TaxID=763407 RepID=A0A162UWE8_PHYB8|nr:hypothetical protein PHYBLDRAFT_140507 [Phycomyces blakesleeanus NRRL 1555(-)]OAD78422.1 hypothetical protein PHYBLDRAFT_140507 [Phycomyces blakesleeanus NRRL 1555(-)]|eukprot:XP_018296462.1 hypothetical protein PHYBLDRAFT_140507 [Phycomyces blakesleeanus NRRL 1555(-)]
MNYGILGVGLNCEKTTELKLFNNLIFIIDKIVRANLGSNIRQLLDRNLTSLSEKPAPDVVALCFPPWTLRDGPQ